MERLRFPKRRSGTGSSPAREPDRPYLALSWVALSAFGFASMNVLIKRLSSSVPQFEIAFFRSLVNFAIMLAWMLAAGQTLFPSGKRILLIRGAAGFGSLACGIYAIAHLPLPIAATLNLSSPFFVILYSRLFLSERVGSWSLAWVGVAFCGVMMLVQPQGGGAPLAWGAMVVAALGAAFAGLAMIAVRAATARMGVNAIVLYFTGVSTVLSAPAALLHFTSPSPTELALLIATGLCGTLGQVAMTQAYRYAMAGHVSSMGLLNAGYSALFGWMIFGERLAMTQWLGLAFIGLGIAGVTLRIQWKPRRVAV